MSKGEEIAFDMPLPNCNARNLLQMDALEQAHIVIDLYLWCAMRFPDVFTDKYVYSTTESPDHIAGYPEHITALCRAEYRRLSQHPQWGG